MFATGDSHDILASGHGPYRCLVIPFSAVPRDALTEPVVLPPAPCLLGRNRLQDLESKFALRAPCACPSGHCLGNWPPWGET